MSVLVGYASVHGSTKGIAQRIASVLADRGVQVTTRPMAEAGEVGHHEAFVLGSAIHSRAWLPEAIDFVSRSRGVLSRRPVWLFSVGMPAALRGPWRAFADREATAVLVGPLAGIDARDHELFSGVIAPEHLPRTGRVLFKAMGCKYGDYRDWALVDAYAAGVAEALRSLRNGPVPSQADHIAGNQRNTKPHKSRPGS
ncbi:MAG TPA: flavodoxin domain-containing protein [Spirillospora sp.]|nr:flavodoxin domain-containing protein [Spirillospora sp.]